MKCRHMIALAGAAAMFAGSGAHAAPNITAVINSGHPFLVANNLFSAVISISGFPTGSAIRGIKGTAENPWIVDPLFEGVGFFNLDSVFDPPSSPTPLFADGFYAAPSNDAVLNLSTGNTAQWDSGLIGSASAQPQPSNLGIPTDGDPDDDVGGFALFTDGGDESVAPMLWMSAAPGGIPVGPTTNFRVMRATWPSYSWLRVEFVLVMTTGEEFPLSIGLGVPEPSGACCLPNGDCFIMADITCANYGGTLHASQQCQTGCGVPTTCPADLAPKGGDDVVNVADLLAVIGVWGACGNPSDCPADLAPPGPAGPPVGDNVVNVQDMLAVISAWGACPP